MPRTAELRENASGDPYLHLQSWQQAGQYGGPRLYGAQTQRAVASFSIGVLDTHRHAGINYVPETEWRSTTPHNARQSYRPPDHENYIKLRILPARYHSVELGANGL